MNESVALVAGIVISNSLYLYLAVELCSIEAVACGSALALEELLPRCAVIGGDECSNGSYADIIVSLYRESDKVAEHLSALGKEESHLRRSLVALSGSALLVGVDTLHAVLINGAHHVEVDIAFLEVLIHVLESLSAVDMLEERVSAGLSSAVDVIAGDLSLSGNAPSELHLFLSLEDVEAENLLRSSSINVYLY